jgi:bifunctional DNA-binding transcriptional regulator/antitoxin component of YhaV-PrlF toxin-antitoxin module
MPPRTAVRVKVDQQGRMVLPRAWRDELVDSLPGEIVVRRTGDGLLLSAVERAGEVRSAADGLPVLSIGRPVTNAEVLEAIEQDRSGR